MIIFFKVMNCKSFRRITEVSKLRSSIVEQLQWIAENLEKARDTRIRHKIRIV